MKVKRKIILPGRREFESSVWEVELGPEDIDGELLERWQQGTLQDRLQILCREAQARVLACAVADQMMSNEELTARLEGFLGSAPEWIKKLGE